MQHQSNFIRSAIVLLVEAVLLVGCGRTETNRHYSIDSHDCRAPLALCEQTCVDLEHDPEHCGTCDAACDENAFCAEGACVDRCPAPLVGCEQTCVDPATSREFCGASGDCQGRGAGVACSDDEVCQDGSCVGPPLKSCDEHLALCDDLCVDSNSSPLHCGACNQACSADAFCFEGNCTNRCPEPLIGCDGTCIDPSTSQEFCGAGGDCQDERAGVVCLSEEVCQAGSCLDDNAALADLSVLRGDGRPVGCQHLTPAFDPETHTYVAILTREDLFYPPPRDAKLTAIPQSEFASLSINDAAVDSTEEHSIPLNASTPTLIDVAVTAESGRTQHYFVAVGAAGEPPECPASCSTCDVGETASAVRVTFIEAIPSDGALAVGSSTAFVFEVAPHFFFGTHQYAVEASLDGDFGTVTIDEPGPIFDGPGESQLVTVTVEPSGQAASATLNVTARACAALHRKSPQSPVLLSLNELPPERQFYVNSDPRIGPDGVIAFPAETLSQGLGFAIASLFNLSSAPQTYEIAAHLELDSGSLDDWNWSGEPTPFPPSQELSPGGIRNVLIPLSWTSDSTPPVGTTGRLISTATTTINDAPVSNTLEFPFIVAAPFTCQ